MTGATGLIGVELRKLLEQHGYSVTPLQGKVIPTIELAKLEGFDIFIHLAGENIAGLWTKKKKAKIYESRVLTTKILANKIKALARPPQLILSASALGYYGSHPDKLFTEIDPAGQSFLANVCAHWEEPLKTLPSSTRVIFARFANILSEKGGIVKSLRLPSKIFGSIILGDGSQWVSSIRLEKAVLALKHLIEHADLVGPFNITSPDPLQQRDFACQISQSRRSLKIPASILIFFLGDMARELLLSSIKASPSKLINSNFSDLI